MLSAPQIIADPAGTLQGFGAFARERINTLATTPRQVLALQTFNAMSDLSATRANVLTGNLASAFVPIGGAAARIGNTGRVVAKGTETAAPNAIITDLALDGLEGSLDAPVVRGATEVVPDIIRLSKTRFGQTFTTHSQDATEFLTKRAAGSGMPQGQFLDDQTAARFIQENLGRLSNGPISLPVLNGFPATAIMPNGLFASPTTTRLVPSGKGVKRAHPEL